MKQNKLYGLILAISMLIFSGCGNDTKENPPTPTGPYAFSDATTPLNITGQDENATEAIEISVQLTKYDLGAFGEIVEMKPFPIKYGSLASNIVVTDINGRAVFLYIVPSGSDYNAIRGSTITIQAIFEQPIDPDDNVIIDEDSPPNIILTQDFELTFF